MAPRLDRRKVAVVRLQHAFLAKHLNPLVVAIGAAPAVVDMHQHARSRAHDQHRRVDVAGSAPGRCGRNLEQHPTNLLFWSDVAR